MSDHRYIEADVQRLLSEHGNVSDQSLEITGREGVLVLRGEVESPGRREQIVRLVSERYPDMRVHNDIGVIRCDPPSEPEELP
ncbi:MAG: BON domain-containing protein [Micromonosporaceae bacterium]|nr:BON domain-containing protein [Micromonosporaceae bacterium]